MAVSKHIEKAAGVGILLIAALALVGCDTVEPTEEAQLVVEGFFDAGRPLPVVTLRQSRPLDVSYLADAGTAVTGASVQVQMGEETIRYRARPGHPGQYEPTTSTGRAVRGRAPLAMEVHWQDQHAYARDTVPPSIVLDSVRVQVPEEPVESVLLDSLRLDAPNSELREGFVYPVEVTLWWKGARPARDSSYWVRPHLKPDASFSSTAVDFFLRQDEVLHERTLASSENSYVHWTGVYAVPVESREAAFPDHRLRVSLLRSTSVYARFARSREAPERREPVSNVEGALGIVAGISVDSVWVSVRK